MVDLNDPPGNNRNNDNTLNTGDLGIGSVVRYVEA